MPLSYEIEPGRNLVRTTCNGLLVFEEVIGHFEALERDPHRPGRPNVLLDLTSMISSPETGQIRQAAERISEEKSTLRFGACAIVAVDPATIGIARLFGAFARARFTDVIVVPTVTEAEQWLQLHAHDPGDGAA
jgi:hypothetical protein